MTKEEWRKIVREVVIVVLLALPLYFVNVATLLSYQGVEPWMFAALPTTLMVLLLRRII